MPLIRKDADQTPESLTGADSRTLLMSGTSDERWAAARRLAKIPEAVKALAEALAVEKDARVREAIFTSLAKINTRDAIETMTRYLRSENAAMRTGALDTLSAMSQSVSSYIPGLLSDPDPDIRLLACEIVRRLPGDKATPLLCELLEREEIPNVCAAAVDVLSEVGTSEAIPVLGKCSARFTDITFLNFAIRIAITRIGEDDRGRGSPPP